MDEKIKAKIQKLRKKSRVAYVGSVNENGFPQIKAMLVFENEDCKVQYFSTNTSSKRAAQFLKNPNACVYYCDERGFVGALFTGKIEVLTDHETKAMLWRPGCEMYYPKGVDDEDYCVYKFTAETVNCYHNLSNQTFPIDEL